MRSGKSRIPELERRELRSLGRPGAYIWIVHLDAAWAAVHDSHMELDRVLGIEKRLSMTFPRIRSTCSRTVVAAACAPIPANSPLAYEDAMGGMVEARMNASIMTLGSLWYSAPGWTPGNRTWTDSRTRM